MPLYRPTDLKALLERLSIRPKKGLSQNFLIDGNILRKMVSAAEVAVGDLIVEIGPGPGALTECLLGCNAEVLAIEKDVILAEALTHLPGASERLEVYCSDILDFPLADQLSHRKRSAKVVANLPYHLTSPILGLLLPMHGLITTIHVMVQEEVARRLVAHPGSKDYSALSLFVQLYAKAHYCFGVSRHCFRPAPRVDSAIVAMTLQATPENIDPVAFLQLVHAAFGQRRKTLKNALQVMLERSVIEEGISALGLSLNVRAEELTLEQFQALYRQLLPAGTRHEPRDDEECQRYRGEQL